MSDFILDSPILKFKSFYKYASIDFSIASKQNIDIYVNILVISNLFTSFKGFFSSLDMVQIGLLRC